MKTVFTLTRADGLNDYVFDTLEEAVNYASDQEFDDDVYEIHKILDDNGYEAECLAIYDLSGEDVGNMPRRWHGTGQKGQKMGKVFLSYDDQMRENKKGNVFTTLDDALEKIKNNGYIGCGVAELYDAYNLTQIGYYLVDYTNCPYWVSYDDVAEEEEEEEDYDN